MIRIDHDDDAIEIVDAVNGVLEARGLRLEDVSLPDTDYALFKLVDKPCP